MGQRDEQVGESKEFQKWKAVNSKENNKIGISDMEHKLLKTIIYWFQLTPEEISASSLTNPLYYSFYVHWLRNKPLFI